MASQTKKWGLFDPLSTAFPTEKETASNNAMIEELKAQNNFEAPAETERRSAVLAELQKITMEFVKHVGKKKGLSQGQISDAGGKVATYGSFRLGVFGPGSDIDTLVVAPKHVSREDFFEHFPSILNDMSPAGAVTELAAVPDAYVPIIKLEYSGISIDLIFARLLVSAVPFSLNLKEDTLLRGLDEVDQRCLNGTRVSDMIIDLVPQQKTFRHTLRTIKLWAQRRAIYANVMGFPGGVAWAMMVAAVCQFYPQACGSVMVSKFFNIMSTWNWPRPIMLKAIDDNPPGMQAKIWNPVINRSDKSHLMPIITPAYPSMCATHNITHSTQKTILKELKRGKELTQQIFEEKMRWKDLFQKHTFFTKDYKYYLSITSASKTKDAQLIWSGLVESKVRRLVASVEEMQTNISIVRPFTKGFDRVHRCHSEQHVDEVLVGKLEHLIKDSNAETNGGKENVAHVAAAQGNAEKLEMPDIDKDKKEASESEPTTIYTTTYYVGIELVEGATSLDITMAVNEFVRQCKAWQQYNPDLNSVRVTHTRNYDLPADVFEPGEEKPVKGKKPKATRTDSSATKKRNFSATNLQAPTQNGTKKRQVSSSSTVAPTAG
ncbi:MAG: polynucleotide adenylyltransferase [Chrysothrix sp. TS-e1954]|nr:MAG: polynucleotide adenylyltransferase [Chrysothrix sp. TS-e1954]